MSLLALFNFTRERQAIATLRPLLRLAPGTLARVVGFGVATALFEGLGISLFLPLFHSLTQGDSMVAPPLLGRLWQGLLIQMPAEQVAVVAPLAILTLLVAKNGLLYLNTLTVSHANWQISHRLRSRLFGQLLAADSQFLMARDPGTLMSILDKEAWQTTQSIATLAVLIVSLCTLAVFSGLLLLTSWRLTLLSLGVLGLISALIQALMGRTKAMGQRATAANQRFVGQGFEQLAGLETIRQFGQQGAEQRRFDRTSEQMCGAFMRLDQTMGAIAPLSELAFAGLLTGLLVLVLHRDTADLAVVLTFLLILYRLSPQLKTLDAARANLVALAASVQVITDLLADSDRHRLSSGSVPFATLTQGIRFRAVTFAYRGSDGAVIHDLSLTIPAGKTTAFVGPSGGGKSTIIGLILRRFDPRSGAIAVDDLPLAEYDLDSWYSAIAVVSQTPTLFNTTVRDNIAYGLPDASEAAVVAAAQQADAHGFITQLSQGYNTVIGDRGVRLSGGQRQRLALARCLVRNPQILILDEATNALDSLSEAFIQTTLATVGRDRTVIIIAHRLSTIEQADQVFVVDSGQLLEQGTVPQLIQKDGLFAQMYRLQSSPLAH